MQETHPANSRSTEVKAMPIASVGHALFAGAFVGIGILGLIRSEFVAVWNGVPNDLPGHEWLARFSAAVSLACGLGLFWPRTAALIALLVQEYDEAIEFYTKKLNLSVVEDTYIPDQDKRWVLIAPPGSRGTNLLLARPSTPRQGRFVGNQTDGRVSFFLGTDDFWRDYQAMVARGVQFVRKPKEASYGTVAVFRDLYGNLWDLLEMKSAPSAAV